MSMGEWFGVSSLKLDSHQKSSVFGQHHKGLIQHVNMVNVLGYETIDYKVMREVIPGT